MNPTYTKQYEFINNIMEQNKFKKVASLNNRLLSDKNYKLKAHESVNDTKSISWIGVVCYKLQFNE